MKTQPSSSKKNVAGHKHGRVPRAVREQQILDIAEQQFINIGYEKTTVESVRLEAGVSRPVIYDHFGSKEKLYLACVKRAREEYQARLQAVYETPAPIDELIEQGAQVYFSIVEEDPRRWKVLFASSFAPMFGDIWDELYEARQGTVRLMTSLMKSFAPNEDEEKLQVFAQAVSAAGDQISHWWLLHPEIPKARIVAHFVSFISSGLIPIVTEAES